MTFSPWHNGHTIFVARRAAGAAGAAGRHSFNPLSSWVNELTSLVKEPTFMYSITAIVAKPTNTRNITKLLRGIAERR